MDIFLILIWYIVFLLSTTFHEAAHAFATKLSGDPTASNGGQVSLDPLPHIKREPLGMVIFPLIFLFINGFPMGWASTPYNPFWARENHRKAALMALAGPGANLILVIISGIILKIGISYHWFNEGQIIESAYGKSSYDLPAFVKILSITFFLNFILFIFNLLPLPGLDGSNAITGVMKKSTAISYMNAISNPGLAFLSIFIAWQIFPYIFEPAIRFAWTVIF